MSELYRIEVSGRPDPHTVEFFIKVVHPDSMYITDGLGFALMLLQEGKEESALAEEVDYDSVTDTNWLSKYARGFVADVKVHSRENEMPSAADGNYDHKYWDGRENWLKAYMTVRVTHPAWAAHLEEGDGWDSASYDPHLAYDDCDPVAPTPASASSADADFKDSKGFIPMPKYFFEYTIDAAEDIVWIPIYGENAYVATETLKKGEITEEKLAAWIGRPVFYENAYNKSLGVLCTMNSTFTISSGSYGSGGISLTSLKSISLAAFNSSKTRLNDPISYEKLLDWASMVVHSVKVDGTVAEFDLYAFGPYSTPQFENAGNALQFIASMLANSFNEFIDEAAPLSQLLKREKEAREEHFLSAVYKAIANGIIVSSEIKKVKDATHPNLDELDNAALLKELEKHPWAQWSIKIEVSDPAWISHLPEKVPFHGEFNWVEEPEAWEGELLKHN